MNINNEAYEQFAQDDTKNNVYGDSKNISQDRGST